MPPPYSLQTLFFLLAPGFLGRAEDTWAEVPIWACAPPPLVRKPYTCSHPRFRDTPASWSPEWILSRWDPLQMGSLIRLWA